MLSSTPHWPWYLYPVIRPLVLSLCDLVTLFVSIYVSKMPCVIQRKPISFVVSFSHSFFALSLISVKAFAILGCYAVRHLRRGYAATAPRLKPEIYVQHHHHHHHGVANTQVGHLLTCSGLAHPEVSSLVSPGSFDCLPWFLQWSPPVPSVVSPCSFNSLPRFLQWSPLVPSVVSPGSFSSLPLFLQ